ncbi:hypothetical protein N658DRAFT_112560 [Parathielavia hyrcaniae]|uniref:Uncharacterized protein n=1 Tax=Parathielavia hyrcaniae TaxID=113614 RepID=A0AAN6QAL2_9PEZI|nr:hypothetical protein N658DRAFT_112560 [Parathielavia hyrcaniae]
MHGYVEKFMPVVALLPPNATVLYSLECLPNKIQQAADSTFERPSDQEQQSRRQELSLPTTRPPAKQAMGMNNGRCPAPPIGSGGQRMPGIPETDRLHAYPLRPPTQSRRKSPIRQPINLAAIGNDELLREVKILTPQGVWVSFPNALISPKWSESMITSEMAELVGREILALPPALSRRCWSSRGPIPVTRAVNALLFEVKVRTLKPVMASMLPIWETEIEGPLGLNLILGRPFIQQYFGHDWPLSDCLQAGGNAITFEVTAPDDVPMVGVYGANLPRATDVFGNYPPTTNPFTANVPVPGPSTAQSPGARSPVVDYDMVNHWLANTQHFSP